MTSRQFAISVVTKLQTAGFQAFWAGGCVRDQLLGREPKDYDVATDARPEQIRELFGQKRTLAIGAAFGVITVLGPRSTDPIEVATFRRDADYSDGRHPDAVEFTDAREDAIRRDFTINGMFFDPITDQVIDYVGGEDDLSRKMIRAIGDPHQRIAEDKLRMLRGVRFAAAFGFEIDPETFLAISQHAAEITIVSPERIGAELVRMLSHPNRVHAAKLLLATGLLRIVLPGKLLKNISIAEVDWNARLLALGRLNSRSFEPTVYLLLRPLISGPKVKELGSTNRSQIAVQLLQTAWRLTNQQRDTLIWLAANWRVFVDADTVPWSQIQPLLIHPAANEAIAVALAINGTSSGIDFSQQRLAWPIEKLNPTPLIDGEDLISMEINPGPDFKFLLQAIRDRQLDGEIANADSAKQFVRQWLASNRN